ncbi:MAG: hypothetical protein N3F66_08925, partial [Spirochaetes bacterium]|nr:hypothetical protein [Spirochaetota bacterium]
MKIIVVLVVGIILSGVIVATAILIGNNEIKLYIDYSLSVPYTEMALQSSKDIFVISDIDSMNKDVAQKLIITFTPKLEYRIKPLDARNCIIEILNPLPANEYYFTVTVNNVDKKDLKITLNNKEIELEKEYYFVTPLLEVSNWYRDSKLLNAPITLKFNFPVSLEILKKNISISPKVDFDIVYDTNDTKNTTVIVKPKDEKKATQYKLTISREMTPIGGVKGMESKFTCNYETFYPFELMEVQSSYGRYNNDSSFYPDYPIEFIFNNPIKLKEDESIASYITISPNPGGVQISRFGSTISISGNFIGKKKYTVTIAKNLKDDYDQTLGQDIRKTITFEHAFSYFSCPTGNMIIESYLDTIIPIRLVNVSSFTCKYLSLTNDSDIAKYIASPKEYFDEYAKEKKYSVNWSWDVYKTIKYDFSKLHNAKHGLFVYQIIPKEENPYSKSKEMYSGIIQISDIGVTVKETKNHILFHVRSLLDNKPLEGALVFYSYSTSPASITDSKGVAIIPNSKCQFYLVKHSESRFYYSKAKESYDDEYDEYDDNNINTFSIPQRYWGSSYHINRPEMLLFTDRYLYKPGDVVHVKGIFRYRNNDEWSLKPLFSPIGNIVIKVFDSKNNEITSFRKALTHDGDV